MHAGTMLKNKTKIILEVKQLTKHFPLQEGLIFQKQIGAVKAVDGIDFAIHEGETLGLVGESGCGKTITALSLMLLHPQPEGKIENGNIYYYPDGDSCIDIAKLGIYSKQIRDIRGNEIAMIFQEPMMSLNPVYKVGQQIMEAILLHQKVDKIEAKETISK